MTEVEIDRRLRRMYAALGDVSGFKPEDVETPSVGSGNERINVDFTGGRSQDLLDIDAAKVINEIMGVRDRVKGWLTSKGDDPGKVDRFVKGELAVTLVHDLANTDKHGKLDRTTASGHKPHLVNVSRGMTLKYDPASGTYGSSGCFTSSAYNLDTGERSGRGSSSNLEVVLIGQILDEGGKELGELQKVLPDAIYKWEQFLKSLGLPI